MDIFTLFYYQALWLNGIDFVFWLVILFGSLASVVKGADKVKEKGLGCFYTLRLIMFSIIFYSVWKLFQLTLTDYMPIAVDVGFHGLIASLFIWTIHFHRKKTRHWKQHEHSRQSTTVDRHPESASPTA